jgi:hypothetical protein
MPASLPTQGTSPLPPEDRFTHTAFLFFMGSVGLATLAGLISLFFV